MANSPVFILNLFLAVLGLHHWAWAFSARGEQGLLSSCSTWASHCSGFSCCATQALGTWASAVAACGLQRAGSVVWCMGLVALRHVEASQTRDQTHVP